MCNGQQYVNNNGSMTTALNAVLDRIETVGSNTAYWYLPAMQYTRSNGNVDNMELQATIDYTTALIIGQVATN